jgi:hypothetical protein
MARHRKRAKRRSAVTVRNRERTPPHIVAGPAVRFFNEAGFSAFARQRRVTINGIETDVDRFSGRSHAIDSFVAAHFSSDLEESIRTHAALDPDDELIRTIDGFEIFRGDTLLCSIHATRAEIPDEGEVAGNFLTAGGHWQRTAQAIERRVAFTETGLDPRLASLLERVLPGKQPHLITDAPDDVDESVVRQAVAASEEIRLRRQLALDRPAVLRVERVRLRFKPVRPAAGTFYCPFEIWLGSEEVAGALILENETDPLPVVIDEEAGDRDGTAWALSLIGFATLACPQPAREATRARAITNQPHRHAERRRQRGTPANYRIVPRTAPLFSSALVPLSGDAHAAHLVAGHRRRLYDGRQPSDEAISRALEYGIRLGPDETWVRPHARGGADQAEVEFIWHLAEELRPLVFG